MSSNFELDDGADSGFSVTISKSPEIWLICSSDSPS